MKHLLSYICVILLLSCNADRQIEKNQIREFKTVLGKTEAKQLDDIVRDFDSFLDQKYKNKNSDSALRQYLQEIANLNNPEIWKIDELKRKEYHTSNLFAKYDSIYPDSVWIENDLLNLKYNELEAIQSIIPINKPNLDSVMNE